MKRLSPAQHHPTNRSLAEFRNYWGESHGPLFSNTSNLRRYVQHITLPEAYGLDPAPTFDGISMFWYDEYRPPSDTPPESRAVELQRAVRDDDAQLFDRERSWPTHLKRASVIAEEIVVLDGPTTEEMVKAIFVVAKLPGLTLNQFFEHWREQQGRLTQQVPGLRRYVQNHAIPEAYREGGQTHDGWTEMWFDDLSSLHRAAASPEWQAARAHGTTLFEANVGVGVARERIQKDLDWTYNDWGVGALSEDAILERLRADHYVALADDPRAPGQIKAAANSEALAVWTAEHLVTLDESRIDARPERS
jgi:uncharacterized protein (TIGR02118 family)